LFLAVAIFLYSWTIYRRDLTYFISLATSASAVFIYDTLWSF